MFSTCHSQRQHVGTLYFRFIVGGHVFIFFIIPRSHLHVKLSRKNHVKLAKWSGSEWVYVAITGSIYMAVTGCTLQPSS